MSNEIELKIIGTQGKNYICNVELSESGDEILLNPSNVVEIVKYLLVEQEDMVVDVVKEHAINKLMWGL